MASLVKELFFCGLRDVDGLPIASGQVYFYVNGSTSTLVNTYADAAELTLLTQPIVLDAAGRATVYTREQSEMKVLDAFGAQKLLTTNGTSVDAKQVVAPWGGGEYSQDYVNEAIEASLGAGGNYIESASPGSTPRHIHDVLHSSVSPRDFQAVGDGSADDTIPLQRAINRAITCNIPLHLEGGTYKITSGLTVNDSLRIYGDGPAQSRIVSSSDSFDAITITVPGGKTDAGFDLRDFNVVLPSAGAGNYAIKVMAGNNGRFVGLRLTATSGIQTAANTTGHIAIGCTVNIYGTSGQNGYGILFQGDGCAITGCSVTGAQYTQGLSAASYSVISGCVTNLCTFGYSLGTSVVASGCKANSCGTAFQIGGGYSGMVGCSAVTCGASYAGIPAINVGNNWVVPVPTVTLTSGAGAPTFTFNPSSTINVFVATASSSTGAITIAWPSSPTLVVGCVYTLVVSTTGTTWSTLTLPSQMKAGASPGTMYPGNSVLATFIVTTLTTLLQLTPWSLANGGTWA
jgi:hypothetical protein